MPSVSKFIFTEPPAWLWSYSSLLEGSRQTVSRIVELRFSQLPHVLPYITCFNRCFHVNFPSTFEEHRRLNGLPASTHQSILERLLKTLNSRYLIQKEAVLATFLEPLTLDRAVLKSLCHNVCHWNQNEHSSCEFQ